MRRHHSLLDCGIAAMRAGDLARLLLRLETVAVTEPPLEFVAGAQRNVNRIIEPTS